MKYSIDELKKQTIALDFSKKDYIENFNLIDLANYTNERIKEVTNEINTEILNLNNSEIKSVDDLYNKIVNLSSNSKLPTLISTLNLLQRIKIDLNN